MKSYSTPFDPSSFPQLETTTNNGFTPTASSSVPITIPTVNFTIPSSLAALLPSLPSNPTPIPTPLNRTVIPTTTAVIAPITVVSSTNTLPLATESGKGGGGLLNSGTVVNQMLTVAKQVKQRKKMSNDSDDDWD